MSNRTTCRLSAVGFLLLLAASSALASGGSGLSWNFQRTGVVSQYPMTAVAMRDGLNWPVIFASENTAVQAISLYPVKNTVTNTNWHPIGSGLMPAGAGQARIRAASSPTGPFAATSTLTPTNSCGMTGSSLTGWGSLPGTVLSVDYDSSGNLITLTSSTVPGVSGTPKDIDSSTPGTVGVVSSNGGTTNYYQTSPLLGGWASTTLNSYGPALVGDTLDLAIDASGRPHVAGVTSTGDVYVFDFNILSGVWAATNLGDVPNLASMPTLAVDSEGRVGATWISDLGELKYACKNGISPWATGVVATSVIDPILGGSAVPVLAQQTPGLAYDANDFPVISFMTNDGKIWLAYDPPSPSPEPSSLLLVVSALLAVAGQRRRSR